MTHTAAPTRLVPIREAATYAGRSPNTLDRYVRAGKLPAYTRGNRSRFVSLDDIDEILTPKRVPVA